MIRKTSSKISTAHGGLFQWTQGQVDDLNQWISETTSLLEIMWSQMYTSHDKLYGDSHNAPDECPVCANRARHKLEEKAHTKRIDIKEG